MHSDFRALKAQNFVDVLRQPEMLSGGDSLVPLLRCGNVKEFYKEHSMNFLYFGDIFDAPKQEVMNIEYKLMVWKKGDVVNRHIFSDMCRSLAIRK